MLTNTQKETIRFAYAIAIAKQFPDFSTEEVIEDIYIGGEDPGQWGDERTVITILTEAKAIPSPVDEIDYSCFGGDGYHFYCEDWFKIDEVVRQATGLEVFSEPVNGAVVNVWEI